ncbi:hypothetical protein [Lacticaseibacillus rhamnosus]|uniref:hypothetical protein n=1 Tax=Lacticaseibacillus rhamnosus TaxID=47715 RepID=UPI000A4D8CCC|nr:hypothetical protein [Lacticaseibacillus rhamnosus]
MKTSLIGQWIQSQSMSMYDTKNRQAWIKAMRMAGIDEPTIMHVYKIRFKKQFVEAAK